MARERGGTVTGSDALVSRDSSRPAGSRPALIAGIDEAGLGPLLGPLAIGYSVLALPRAEDDPWRLLNRAVARGVTAKERRLVVADSKKVFTRNAKGWKRLEATVLGFLALLDETGPSAGPPPKTFSSVPSGRSRVGSKRLLGTRSCRACPARSRRRTWSSRRHSCDATCEKAGLRLCDAGVRIVPAGELNASYRETSNKGATVWKLCLEVLRYLWDRHGADDPFVTVDLLGGRTHYANLLAAGFPEAEVETVSESEGFAAYTLVERDEHGDRWLPRRLRLEFRAKGEEASFAVALGSCVAKYARELVMLAFNDTFAALQPELRPTAGYTTDGRRWLAEGPSRRSRSWRYRARR